MLLKGGGMSWQTTAKCNDHNVTLMDKELQECLEKSRWKRNLNLVDD